MKLRQHAKPPVLKLVEMLQTFGDVSRFPELPEAVGDLARRYFLALEGLCSDHFEEMGLSPAQCEIIKHYMLWFLRLDTAGIVHPTGDDGDVCRECLDSWDDSFWEYGILTLGYGNIISFSGENSGKTSCCMCGKTRIFAHDGICELTSVQ